LEDVRPEATNDTTYLLLRGKTNRAVVNIACYLQGREGLLPLPEGSGQLDNLLALTLQKNSVGTVVAQGLGLAVFDARFGPGAAMDSAATPMKTATCISRNCLPLEQVVSELQLTNQNQSLDQVLRRLNGFFQSKFTYSTWQPVDQVVNTNETPVTRFLLRDRSGHVNILRPRPFSCCAN